jgi:hypothetical protein
MHSFMHACIGIVERVTFYSLQPCFFMLLHASTPQPSSVVHHKYANYFVPPIGGRIKWNGRGTRDARERGKEGRQADKQASRQAGKKKRMSDAGMQ